MQDLTELLSKGEDILINVLTNVYLIPLIVQLKLLLVSLVILVVTLVTNFVTVGNIPPENGFGDQKLLTLTLKDPRILGYQKEIYLLVLQEHTRKTDKKEMWVDASNTCVEREKISNFKKHWLRICKI